MKFSALAAELLASADALVLRWLPGGKKEGHEYKALNPLRADSKTGSFSVNLHIGKWADFATGDKGGDLVSLYAYLFTGGKQSEAARQIEEDMGIFQDKKPPEKPAEKPEKTDDWIPVLPVPDDAPAPPKAESYRGLPESTWTYKDAEDRVLGYVYRFRTSDGGKDIKPLTFCRHSATGHTDWRWKQFSETNRPLYGLDRLAARPDAPVLIAEGEKCADAAQKKFPDKVAVSWSGGANAVDKSDFSPLFGRRVYTWADSDSKREPLSRAEKAAGIDPETKPYLPPEKQPGYRAMAAIRQKLAGKCRLWDVQIPAPGVQPDGYDVADLIAENPDIDLAAYIHERAEAVKTGKAEKSAADKSLREPYKAEEWRETLRWKNRLMYAECLANLRRFLRFHPAWAGVLAYDEFSNVVRKIKPPPFDGGEIGEWTENDTARLTIWLSEHEPLDASTAKLEEAVETAARENRIHPVRDWLNSLPKWDFISRLEMWAIDHLGAPDKPDIRLVSKLFLIGMVKRVFEPGCKFDYMLVLEGYQGIGKSSALAILAGEWFSDTPLDLNNIKDSAGGIQGIWLHEFSELHAFAKAEATRVKSFLSSQMDKYRPPYGRRDIKAPRQCVFGGSTNERQWNKDTTGGRRFWAIHCGDLNLDGLKNAKDMLFAEALYRYLQGEKCYPTKEEQQEILNKEQERFEVPNPYVELLFDWVRAQYAPFTITQSAIDGLKLSVDKITPQLTNNIGIALTKLGCGWAEKRHGDIRCYRTPPDKKDDKNDDKTAKGNANETAF
jgi:predicted P-loop ATPase